VRFVVDLHRYIIYLFCALALIGAALVALSAADHTTALGASLTAVVMNLDHGVPEMDFALDGSQARGLLFAAKGPDVSFKVTIADKGPAGSNIRNITLHMIAKAIIRQTTQLLVVKYLPPDG